MKKAFKVEGFFESNFKFIQLLNGNQVDVKLQHVAQ